jgi:hypothetical protein
MSDHGLQFRLAKKAWSSLEERVERYTVEKKSSEEFESLIFGWINSYSIAIAENEWAFVVRRLLRISRPYLGQLENNPPLIQSPSDAENSSFS